VPAISKPERPLLHHHEEDRYQDQEIMPPTMGAAIGFMTSEPIPGSQRIGARLTDRPNIPCRGCVMLFSFDVDPGFKSALLLYPSGRVSL